MVSRCNQTRPPNTGDVGAALDAQRLAFGSGSLERLDLNSEAFGADGTRAIHDLAMSFPALLFALTTGYGTPERRQACLTAIVGGARLKTAAEILGLPFWLRRLPAAALTGPLPTLPDDREYALAVVPALPKSPDAMLPWLDFLSLADRLAGRDVCLWFLRNPRLTPPTAQPSDALWMLARSPGASSAGRGRHVSARGRRARRRPTGASASRAYWRLAADSPTRGSRMAGRWGTT